MIQSKKVTSNSLEIILADDYGADGHIVITDKHYDQFIEKKDQQAIAKFLFYRLSGRYLKPFTFKNKLFESEYKNGFSIMANCCLLIEALQSFKNGWEETPRQENGDRVFDDFFQGHTALQLFKGRKFYKNIRCGILHQGETTGRWKIRRDGPLLKDKTINAVKFLEQMRKALEIYTEELKKAEWDSETWDNCRTKMRKIIKHCKQ